MHIKKLLVLPIISSLLITGCIKGVDEQEVQEKEPPKQEELQISLFEEAIKDARKAIIKSDYNGAESILVLALSEDEENEDLNRLYRQVKVLIEIEEKIKEKKYDEARVRCTILLLEEKIDKSIEYEVERLKDELDKLGESRPSDSKKNRNIKIDKNKDISPQKAMDIVSEYIKKNYPGSKPKVYIVDMYLVDGQSYYYIYAYRIKNIGGYAKEEAIGYYDVNMRNGEIIEYLICNPNYKVNISEDKAIELAEKYMSKYTDYKAESFKILNIASDCGDTFYCIEAYGRDENNYLICVGYFEVHVETGVVRGDVCPPELEIEEPSIQQPSKENKDDNDSENTDEELEEEQKSNAGSSDLEAIEINTEQNQTQETQN